MTEFNNNNKYVPQAPKTYEVKYVEQQDLYPDLGYNDISETRGYGPCSYSGCSNNKRFCLKAEFKQSNLFNWHFKDFSGRINGGEKFNRLVMSNVAQARYAVSSFEDGTYEIVGATGDWNTTNAQNKKSEVVSLIRSLISCHESGREINQENDFTDDSGMPPRWEDGREVYQGTNAFDW